MPLSKEDAPESIYGLAKNLLSRNAVQFNSIVNSNFAAHSTYKGHGLTVKGASNIKHIAHLFNALDLGRHAIVDERSIEWDSSNNTATFESLRFIRPRLFPVFELAFPVRTTLRFERPQGYDKPTQDQSNKELLLISHFEDEWIAERLLSYVAPLAQLYWNFVSPLVSFFVLVIANTFFRIESSFNSTTRTAYHAVEPAAKSYAQQAERIVPRNVKDGLNRGINDGIHLAEGYGEKAVNFVFGVARKPLELLEWSAGKGASVANFFLPRKLALPTPYVFSHDDDAVYVGSKKRPAESFEADAPAPKRHEADRNGGASSSHAQTTLVDEVEGRVNDHGAAKPDSPPQNDHAELAAEVEVGPSTDGQYAGYSVNVPEAVAGSSAGQQPAPLATEAEGSSSSSDKKEGLYQQLQQEGELNAPEENVEKPSEGSSDNKNANKGSNNKGGGGGQGGSQKRGNKKNHKKKH